MTWRAKCALQICFGWYANTVGFWRESVARIFPFRCIMAKSNRTTSAKSKRKSAKIDRPFDRALLERARQIAERYRIIIHREDGEFYGQALELPGVLNDGKTADECVKNTVDILTTTIATMLESGQIPPLPASDERRDEQVNVRLSKLEKLTFEEAARSRGFRGLSDFLRTATLGSVKK